MELFSLTTLKCWIKISGIWIRYYCSSSMNSMVVIIYEESHLSSFMHKKIQMLLFPFQRLLDEIKSWKNNQSDEDLAYLQDSIQPLDEILENIETSAMPKLKSLLLLREQFTTLIMQIVGFITETTARVGEVDANSANVKEKIDKYDQVIFSEIWQRMPY